MKILFMGDSIAQGWNGSSVAPDTLETIIAAKTGNIVINAGIGGTQVSAGSQSFDAEVKQYNFNQYDAVIVLYGTNDFGHQEETIDDFKTGYQKGIDKIKKDNPSIRLMLLTPIRDWGLGNGDMDWKNNKGISQNMISDTIVILAQSNGAEVYDWRKNPVVTKQSQVAQDGIHPLNSTYELMGAALAEWVGVSSDNGSGDILSKMAGYKYIYFGFDPKNEDASHPYAATPALCGSNDGVKYDLIAEFPQLDGLRDGSMVKYNDTYWITGTLGIYSTTDFTSFKSYDTSCFKKDGYTNVWAPEFFIDMNGSWHLSYCAQDNSDKLWHTFVDDFDPDTGTVSNAWQKVNSSTGLDPHYFIVDGKYYLFIDGYWLYSSDSYLGPFTEVKTNIQHPGLDWKQSADGSWQTVGNDWYEASATIIDGDKIFLYMDHIDHNIPGVTSSGYMVVQTANTSNLASWSGPQKVQSSINMRHGSFLLQDKQTTGTTVDKLALTMLGDDPFGLKNNVTSNTTKTVIAINSLYKLCKRLLDVDSNGVTINTKISNDGLDRVLRNFVIHAFDQIKEDVNDLVNLFNKNEFWNFKTGEPIKLLVIKRPTELRLNSKEEDGSDGYLMIINDNWKAIETKVNELFAITDQFNHKNKKGE